MTIAPAPQTSSAYHHPRSSPNHLGRDLDFLHQLAAQVPTNSNRDINNNELEMELCCDAGCKPSKLNMTLNGDQLCVFGQGSQNKHLRCFGETFLLPENVDPNNIYCEIKPNNQLSINMHQMCFEANASSTMPFGSAKTSGGLW